MPHYVVTAVPIWENLPSLKVALDNGGVESNVQYGPKMAAGLRSARWDKEYKYAIWVEEAGSDELKDEIHAWLQHYFTEIKVKKTNTPRKESDKTASFKSIWNFVPYGP